MRTQTKTLAALALATLLVLSAVAMPAGAAGVDTETTDTASQSELTDGDTVDNFNASDSDQLPTLQASYQSDNPEIQIRADGELIDSFTNSSNPDYFDGTGSASGTHYFNTTFNESDFATVAMDASENKSVTLRLIDNASVDDPAGSAMANVTVHLNNTAERAVVRAGADAESTGLADLTSTDGVSILSSLGIFEATDIATIESTSVGVNGSDTDVHVVYANDSVADPFESAAENQSSWIPFAGTSSYSDGDRIGDIQTTVDDQLYVTYSESAPDAVADEADATYSAYGSLNGEPTQTIVLGDEDFEDATSVDVTTVGNQSPDINIPFFGDAGVKSYEDGGLLGMFGL